MARSRAASVDATGKEVIERRGGGGLHGGDLGASAVPLRGRPV